MKNLISSFFILYTIVTSAQLPQKYDSLYKTIFAKDFCKMIEQNSQIVLLDVRSAGEFCDTSVRSSLNMGHLKGAINMEIDSIKKNMAAMNKYRDKTLVIYCSHSQRSRRVSKLLSENGFIDFYNLNGGMSSINQMTPKEFPCKQSWMESNLGYKNASNTEAVELYNQEKNMVVLDVRPSSQYESKDSLEENNIGRIKGAINIPYTQLKQKIDELKKYTDTPILIYAGSGDGDAARAANELVSNKFKKVYHLLDGLNSLIASQKNLAIIENPLPFHLIDAVQTLELLKGIPAPVIYDTRPKAEFENKDEKAWKNLGHMKNAIHVNEGDFEKVGFPADKKSPVLIYGYTEAYKLGKAISLKGYKNVYLLEGFYDFVWSSFNVESCKEAKNYIVNHEGLF